MENIIQNKKWTLFIAWNTVKAIFTIKFTSFSYPHLSIKFYLATFAVLLFDLFFYAGIYSCILYLNLNLIFVICKPVFYI